MRRFLFGLFVIAGLLSTPVLPAIAETSDGAPISQTITLSGVVPEMRVLYISQDGYLVKVVGNTPNNVIPTAATLDNKPVPMTDSIRTQYSTFMESHNWHLEAGREYAVNPVSVNNEPNRQAISVTNIPPAETITLVSGQSG